MYYLTVDNMGMSDQVGIGGASLPVGVSIKRILTLLGIGLLSLILFVIVCLSAIYFNARSLLTSLDTTVSLVQAGNIAFAKEEIAKSIKAIGIIQRNYTLISWTQSLPLIGSYSKDLKNVISVSQASLSVGEVFLTSIEPSIGLLATESVDPEEIYSQRSSFLAEALPTLSTSLESVSDEIETADRGISQINPNRYPKRYQGRISSLLASGGFFVDVVKSVKALPFLLGIDTPKQYLILFQNDKEIRPTGGFMTAYSIMKVEKGKFSAVTSEDIYSLDAKYKPTVPAPEPLVKYIKGPYVVSQNLRLRDMNWSPDFGSSMINFRTAAREAGISNIDGIIAVDTQALVNVMEVLGDVGVPGFGTFNTDLVPECKCPQVIHELESFADVEGPIVWDPVSGEIVYKPENADNRKKIIGPLMNSVIASVLSSPKEKFPLLISSSVKSLREKHILFYIFNDEIQSTISDIDLDGRIKDYEGDYLHINDANLGGRKSNLYVTQEVSQEIEVDKNGDVVKTLTLTYKNPEKHDGWLNSVLPNWVRVYVPKGSELITSEGLEEKAEPYEDLGKTVFAGLFQLRPEGVSKVSFKYKLPMKMKGQYRLMIQKQPGTASPLYTIILGDHEEEIPLNRDKEIEIAI